MGAGFWKQTVLNFEMSKLKVSKYSYISEIRLYTQRI